MAKESEGCLLFRFSFVDPLRDRKVTRDVIVHALLAHTSLGVRIDETQGDTTLARSTHSSYDKRLTSKKEKGELGPKAKSKMQRAPELILSFVSGVA